MRLSKLALTLVAGPLVACGERPAEVSTASDPILNGLPLDNAAAAASPAVSIRTKVPIPNLDNVVDEDLGAGTLLAPNAVLTVEHVTRFTALQNYTVVQGNSADEIRANVIEVRRFP